MLTMFPVMRGPGAMPLTTTAARVKPSGATFALEITRSVTGPMPAYAEVAKSRVMYESNDWNRAIVVRVRRGECDFRWVGVVPLPQALYSSTEAGAPENRMEVTEAGMSAGP